MAYNSMFPTTYQPMAYQPAAYIPNNYATQNQQAQASSSLIWVQGEAGAKSYLVGAGQSVLLMDSESNTFYIKSTDGSGMPLPLRIFDYKERVQTQTQASAPATATPVFDPDKYVTKEEFNQLVDKLKKEANNEPVV